MIESASTFGLSTHDRGRMEEVQQLARNGAASVPALVELLSGPSWVLRRAVVAALARIGTPAISRLCDVLRFERGNETLLAATVDALAASGGDVEPAVLALAAATTQPAILCDVAQILGRRKSRGAVATLARWSAHADDNVAVAAIEALGRVGGPAVVQPLLEAVRSRNFFRTFPAISVLGESRDPRVVAPLVALLDEPQYTAEAATALGYTGQIAAVAPLSALLGAPREDIVRTAARALFELRQRHAEAFGNSEALIHTLRGAASDTAVAARISAAMRGADGVDTLALACVLSWVGEASAVGRLVDLLHSEALTADEALRALRGMGPAAEPHIRAAIREGDSAQRARLLPLLGARRSVVGELVICLQDPDPQVRAQACDALARIGDATAVGALFGLIGDLDSRVALAAIGAVQSLGSHEARGHAMTAARSDDARTRHAAIRIISYFGYPEGIDVLLAAIADPDDRIRDAATFGLALLDDPRATAALLAATRHPSAATRAAACRALANAILAPPMVTALEEGLQDTDAWVRYYACQSLGKLHVTSAIDAIARLLNDPAGQVRVAAVESTAKLGGARALETLEGACGSVDPDVRRAALGGLGNIRRPQAVPILLRAAEEEDSSTRLVALSAIAATGAPEAEAALMRACADPDDRVRLAAFQLLAVRGGQPSTQWLIERLGHDTDRAAALAALSHPTEGRIEGILLALESANETLASGLVQALVGMRRANGNAAVESVLHMQNVNARRAAASALVSMGTQEAQVALARFAAADPDAQVRRIGAAAGKPGA